MYFKVISPPNQRQICFLLRPSKPVQVVIKAPPPVKKPVAKLLETKEPECLTLLT